jgi:S-DNA-T family DNA segregation ATPase FtsK/SpoIIIE
MRSASELQRLIKAIDSFDPIFSKASIPETVEYTKPSLDLLKDYDNSVPSVPQITRKQKRRLKFFEKTPVLNKNIKGASLDPRVIESKLAEFSIDGKVENIECGPVITRYDIKLGPGVLLSKIRKITDDLAITLMAGKVRVQAPIPGTNLIGIEVENETRSIVPLKHVMGAVQAFKGEIPIGIGVNIIGVPKVLDLVKMPHLLVAGQTGSGKSVGLNSIILSILYTKTPQEVRLVLVDPKRVEMVSYKDSPFLYRSIINDPSDAVETFKSLITEMENRYKILMENGVRNIVSYNMIPGIKKMPYIVTIVDEMADLMMTAGKELEQYIVRLAQLSRAVGIHLVLATQKPKAEIVTGLIKSNIPGRIAFAVTSNMDSRIILDCGGAEKLVGRGDLLMTYPGISEPERYHGAWVSDEEIVAICSKK